jgi:TolA-binding protein
MSNGKSRHWSAGWIAAALILCGAWAPTAEAAPYVVLKAGNRRIDASSIRVRPNGDYVVITPTGQTFDFTRDQVAEAYVDPPPAIRAAADAVREGRYQAAVEPLKDILREYRFLTWDERAAPLLAQAYMGLEEYGQAVRVLEDLFKQAPGAKDDEPGWLYREAMMRAGQTVQLEQELDELIKSGSRDDAARAQIMRGDIDYAAGNFEEAAMDYLRTVVFFKRQTEVLPQATLKTAQALERMRDDRSTEWYQRTVEQFPQTPEAEQARQKL